MAALKARRLIFCKNANCDELLNIYRNYCLELTNKGERDH